MLISAFFDESGKFKDHSTIAFGGVAAVPGDFNAFGSEWEKHLRLNGLKVLTMKQALNSRKPLSPKRKALGITNRIDALLPFVECIRRHLQNVVGIAVDVDAFKASPDHLRRVWSDDPIYMAFARTLLAVMEPVSA